MESTLELALLDHPRLKRMHPRNARSLLLTSAASPYSCTVSGIRTGPSSWRFRQNTGASLCNDHLATPTCCWASPRFAQHQFCPLARNIEACNEHRHDSLRTFVYMTPSEPSGIGSTCFFYSPRVYFLWGGLKKWLVAGGRGG